jgi:hypothetical protein
MKIYNADAGLWLLRENGWHNGYLVVDLAEDWGMPVNEPTAALLREYRRNQADGDESIWEAINGVDGLVDQATAYLQSLVVGDGRFVWIDNDLWLRKG